MNITEALDPCPSHLAERTALQSLPRLRADLIVHEQVETGNSTVVVHIPGTSELFRFLPDHWALLQYFDGRRSCAEACHEFQRQSGKEVSESDVRKFVQMLHDSGFWCYTGRDAYASYAHMETERRKHKKSPLADFARMDLWSCDPDIFLSHVHRYTTWLFSGWFAAFQLLIFSFMLYIFVSRWSEISHDTLLYYNFTRKTAADLLEFWLLFMVLCFIHELGHALACKHYGAGVHRMGFQLLYLEPTFFVEVTEGFVYANRWQRMGIIALGVWSELVCCSVASIVYWGTVAGSPVHDFAYKVMLITGVAVVVVEMIPLIKLDGYYLFCELLEIPDLKERSTTYTMALVKQRIFHIPAERESVTGKRALLFVCFALASGLYSYILLVAIAVFLYHVLQSYMPVWAFVPGLLFGFFIFRSRLRKLFAFTKMVYLDKKALIRSSFSPLRTATLGMTGACLLFIPILHRTSEGRSYLEPVRRAVVRAAVPGEILRIFVDEGQSVEKGAAVASLESLTLDSRAGETQADLALADARTIQAQLRYENPAHAEHERQSVLADAQSVERQVEHLQLLSPISGVVVTPRLQDRIGTYAQSGTTVAEIADLTEMRARIYVPEYQLQYVRVGSKAYVRPDGHFGSFSGVVASLAPAASEVETKLAHSDDYEGIRRPHYYVATVQLANPEGFLKVGMLADAKIYSERRSIAVLIWTEIRQFLERKVW